MLEFIRVGAVVVHANHSPSLADWYTKKLGLKFDKLGQNGFTSLLPSPAGSPETRLLILHAPRAIPAGPRPVLISLLIADFDAAYAHLKQFNVPIEQVIRNATGRGFRVQDGEGNPIEIWEPAPTQLPPATS